MGTSASINRKPLYSAGRMFCAVLVVQLIIGIMVIAGLFNLRFWKTETLEICKLSIVVFQAMKFRNASREDGMPPGAAAQLATAGTALLATGALADAVLIFYNQQLSGGR